MSDPQDGILEQNAKIFLQGRPAPLRPVPQDQVIVMMFACSLAVLG
jgi:hypothetical protein